MVIVSTWQYDGIATCFAQNQKQKGCGDRVFPPTNPDNLKCGTWWGGDLHLCDDCRKLELSEGEKKHG